MGFADFDAARRERQRALEPVEFGLGDIKFKCVKSPTLADAFALATAPEPITFDGTPNLAAVAAIVRFIEALIESPRQKRKFQKLLANRKDVIEKEDIIDLGAWLAGEYSGRPTLRSTDSSDGPQPDGQPSNTEQFSTADPSPT